MGHGGETRRPTTPKSNKQRAANQAVTIKLVNGDDIQAIRTSYDAKLSDLKAVIKDVWGKKMRIKFRDEEEDFISIRRQQDLTNVMNSLASIKSTRLRLTLSSEEAPSPPAPVTDFELLNTVAVPCLVVNPQGTLHYANSAMKQLLPQECVGQPIGRILAGDVRVNAGGAFEAPMLPFTFASQHVLYSSIAGIVESGYLSVTEREINNIKFLIGTIAHYGLPTCLSWLQQERESLDRCSVPGVAIDPTGIVIAWNSAATSFFGYACSSIVFLFSFLHGLMT
jgi:PAS domain-containing protein